MALHGTNGRHRIYLMRHGAVRYFDDSGKPVNPATVKLTEEGRMQAGAVGAALADVPLDRVVCSALPRTRDLPRLPSLGSRRHLPLHRSAGPASDSELLGTRLRAAGSHLHPQEAR